MYLGLDKTLWNHFMYKNTVSFLLLVCLTDYFYIIIECYWVNVAWASLYIMLWYALIFSKEAL